MPAHLRTLLIALALTLPALASTCYSFGTPLTLRGKLVRVNEGNYRRWIGFRPDHPICTSASGSEEEFFPVATSGLKLLHSGSAVEDPDVAQAMEELVNHQVEVEGALLGGVTGYYRTAVFLGIVSLTPRDLSGKKAMQPASPVSTPPSS